MHHQSHRQDRALMEQRTVSSKKNKTDRLEGVEPKTHQRTYRRIRGRPVSEGIVVSSALCAPSQSITGEWKPFKFERTW